MSDFAIGIYGAGKEVLFDIAMANRHGLIAGATGTGKTVTLQYLAEQLSAQGVSVFTADVKGDLAGLAFAAVVNPKLEKRIKDLKIKNFTPQTNPVVFWDLKGQLGHPLRTTISEMGPLLLSRLLDLNDTQQGVLQAAFSLADDQHLLILDIKDLRSVLDWMGNNATDLKSKYGNVAANTLGAIQRALLSLSEAGGDHFFGEPAFKITDFLQKDCNGKGIINILDATQIITDPRLYGTFLLWLLSELFEVMPEVGDQEKPRLVFFFDEAHLLFNSAPKPLLEKIEQLVRLVRSKGVGVYFITQSPADVPETVLSQLSNRVQHALRAFTPKDQKAVKIAAQTLRENSKLDTATEITQLQVGEALVSLLDNTGTPTIVEKVKIFPPHSRIGAITAAERQTIIQKSPFFGVYEHAIDRESAYEIITQRLLKPEISTTETTVIAAKRSPGRPADSILTTIFKSTARTLATESSRRLIRGILGTLFKK